MRKSSLQCDRHTWRVCANTQAPTHAHTSVWSPRQSGKSQESHFWNADIPKAGTQTRQEGNPETCGVHLCECQLLLLIIINNSDAAVSCLNAAGFILPATLPRSFYSGIKLRVLLCPACMSSHRHIKWGHISHLAGML